MSPGTWPDCEGPAGQHGYSNSSDIPHDSRKYDEVNSYEMETRGAHCLQILLHGYHQTFNISKIISVGSTTLRYFQLKSI